MDEIIKIRCPYCTSPLSVKRIEGIEHKSIACPICKKTAPYADFKQIATAANQPYAAGEEANLRSRGQWTPDDNTQRAGRAENKIVGSLYAVSTGKSYPLQKGRNVIGRMAGTSKATIQIPTGDNRSVSREHIVIDVRYVIGRGYVHYVSLYKEEVSPTYIDQSQLLPGEEIAIEDGQQIAMEDVVLRLDIAESDDTTFPGK